MKEILIGLVLGLVVFTAFPGLTQARISGSSSETIVDRLHQMKEL